MKSSNSLLSGTRAIGSYLALSAVLLFSCRNESLHNKSESFNGDKNAINLKEEEAVHIDSLFDSFDSITIGPISHGLLGYADKVILKKDRIFILDQNLSKGLFVFNKEGDFQYQVGHSGSGPGEFLNLEDFDIEEDTVFCYDSGNGRLSKFNLAGKYLGDGPSYRHTNVIPNKVFKVEDQYLLYTKWGGGKTASNYTINLVSDSEDFISEHLDNSFISGLRIDFGNGAFKVKNEVFVTQILNDSIYMVSPEQGKITIPFYINFPSKKITKAAFNSLRERNKNFLYDLLQSESIIGIVNVFANDNSIWLQYLKGSELINVIIERNSGNSTHFKNIMYSIGSPTIDRPVGAENDIYFFYKSNENVNDNTSGILLLAKQKEI